MKNFKLFLVLTIILTVMALTGCRTNDIQAIKANSVMTKEYNDVIAKYNKLALAFTKIAKNIDNELIKTDGFKDEFWKDYDESIDKMMSMKNEIVEYEFINDEIETISKDINPFIEGLEKYLNVVNGFRNSQINKVDFTNRHKDIYDELFKQSSVIVASFDRIYNEFVIGKAD